MCAIPIDVENIYSGCFCASDTLSPFLIALSIMRSSSIVTSFISNAALYIAKEKGKDRYIIYDYNKHGDILADMKHDIAFGSGFMKPMAKLNTYSMNIKLIGKL